VVAVRVVFDSGLSMITAAPGRALPLGSVTVPRRELDEAWGKVTLLKARHTATTDIHRSKHFMAPPTGKLHPRPDFDRRASQLSPEKSGQSCETGYSRRGL
jgi:hypothetical protein